MENEIRLGESLTILKSLPDQVFDLVITSPPYFQQRDYGNDEAGLGEEETESEYLSKLSAIFRECVRTTKEDGVLVFNLGDKYLDGGLALLPYKFALQVLAEGQVFLINQLTWSKLNPYPPSRKTKINSGDRTFLYFCQIKELSF